jgi:hypothetical protein
MEATPGISPYSYPYRKLAETLGLSYYLLCSLFNKIGEEGGTGSTQKLVGGGAVGVDCDPNNVYTCK